MTFRAIFGLFLCVALNAGCKQNDSGHHETNDSDGGVDGGSIDAALFVDGGMDATTEDLGVVDAGVDAPDLGPCVLPTGYVYPTLSSAGEVIAMDTAFDKDGLPLIAYLQARGVYQDGGVLFDDGGFRAFVADDAGFPVPDAGGDLAPVSLFFTRYARVEDGGCDFVTPVEIDSTILPPGLSDPDNDITQPQVRHYISETQPLDISCDVASGKIAIAYQSLVTDVNTVVRFTALDRTHNEWTTPRQISPNQTLSDNSVCASYPSIVATTDGVHVAFVENDGLHLNPYDLYKQHTYYVHIADDDDGNGSYNGTSTREFVPLIDQTSTGADSSETYYAHTQIVVSDAGVPTLFSMQGIDDGSTSAIGVWRHPLLDTDPSVAVPLFTAQHLEYAGVPAFASVLAEADTANIFFAIQHYPDGSIPEDGSVLPSIYFSSQIGTATPSVVNVPTSSGIDQQVLMLRNPATHALVIIASTYEPGTLSAFESPDGTSWTSSTTVTLPTLTDSKLYDLAGTYTESHRLVLSWLQTQSADKSQQTIQVWSETPTSSGTP